MRAARIAHTSLLLIAALASCVGCATSPLGRSQLILVSDQQVAQMGIAAYQQMKEQQPISRTSTVNEYVECVSRAIAVEVRQGDGAIPESWEVTVFDEDSPNAFALPGGKIGVHTGMLKVAENQDQLAAVVGHEIAHVLARHSAERISTAQAADIGLKTIAASGQVGQNTLALLGAGAQYGIVLPYGRTQESEADLLGLDLMARAGFDPRESTQLWRNMEKLGGQKPPEFLSTHPSGQTRIRDLEGRFARALEIQKQARAQGKTPRCR